ncbi:VOC family protein [Hahella sp. NBU794]|uniref:VOC family protein n=1 Tax=Hahella sp. NBU794 TaxID=3422590 RepID=UPI003D6DBEC6
MDIARTGIILNTENYDACVVFYRDLFNLEIQFQEQRGDFQMTCFRYGGAYLLVETGGSAYAGTPENLIHQRPAQLRFNVSNLEQALEEVRAFGITAEIERYAWGSVINIQDPDGNRVGIRDEATFLDQLTDYAKSR